MSKENRKNKKPYTSLIVPLYNEEKRVHNLLKIYQYLNRIDLSYEVILVNDGSTDLTIQKLNNFPKKFKFDLISYPKNTGKGFAIKQGMLKATGKYLLFTDIDLSTPIDEFEKFLPILNKKNVIIGSRKKKSAKLTKRQPFLRESLGKGFTILSKIVLHLDITDFTCGFKCFPRKAAMEIFKRQRIKRWGFDSEILFLAKKLGYSIKEVPVTWSNDSQSRVKFPQDIVTSLIDLLTIRYNEFKKLY